MEKLIAALWAPPGESRPAFAARLRASLPGALHAAGASRVRLNLREAAVDPAAGLVQQWQAPQQDAVVQFWVPSANPRFRGGIEAALAAHAARHALWLVAESEIIADQDPAPAGARGRGWSQASFITFRPDLARGAAIAHWHGHHTRVAIETQANFIYTQNLIATPLSADAPAYDAFVEECFPDAAMADPAAFFAAGGDPARFEANLAAMMDSCQAFIDFTRIDIIPTTWYDCPPTP